MTDPIVQNKSCLHCEKSFDITQWDLDFYTKISPTFAWQKFQIPTPTLCPDCRQRRRLSFRNERTLYKRICDASGKQIISIYSPDKPYKVYDQKIRWSDGWDPMSYGRDFDFSKIFTEQFGELMREVPRMSLNVIQNEQSEYISFAWYNKNCYLIYTADQNENCLYSSYIISNKNCIDCLHTNNSQFCYNVIHGNESYNCFYCINIKSCNYCMFTANMTWSSHCFLSYWQTNVSYCFKNKIYNKEEYQQIVKEYVEKYSYQEIECMRKQMINDYYDTKYTIINCEDSVGKYIVDSRFCQMCENCTQSEYLKYCSFTYKMKNSMDWDFYWDNAELWYDCVNTANNCYKVISTMNCWWSSSNLLYCDLCMYCQDCFWCVGLRNKSYCIFNKQYSKEDYEIQVAKIITHMQSTGEWWEFFHPSLSPFGYNETVAQEYFPIQKWQLEHYGYHRSNYQAPIPQADYIIEWSELPTDISLVSDDILQKSIRCEVTGKLFRLQKMELEFYRKHNIPLPRRHPDQRYLERLALRK